MEYSPRRLVHSPKSSKHLHFCLPLLVSFQNTQHLESCPYCYVKIAADYYFSTIKLISLCYSRFGFKVKWQNKNSSANVTWFLTDWVKTQDCIQQVTVLSYSVFGWFPQIWERLDLFKCMDGKMLGNPTSVHRIGMWNFILEDNVNAIFFQLLPWKWQNTCIQV